MAKIGQKLNFWRYNFVYLWNIQYLCQVGILKHFCSFRKIFDLLPTTFCQKISYFYSEMLSRISRGIRDPARKRSFFPYSRVNLASTAFKKISINIKNINYPILVYTEDWLFIFGSLYALYAHIGMNVRKRNAAFWKGGEKKD